MIYNFLTSEDLDVAIKEDLLAQIVGASTTMVLKAEKRAVKYMADFLRERFKAIDIFPEIKAWNAATNYKVSVSEEVTYTDHLGSEVTEEITPLYYRDGTGKILNVVYKNGKFFIAKADNVNSDPEVNTNDWEEKDPRDENIVGMCVDITLFYLHVRINPRKMPQLRTDMYNQAKEWLTMVQDGDLTPDLPKEIDIKKSIDTPLWGSGPQKGHYY